MSLFNLNVSYKKLLADTTTPVSIYLRLRDKYVNSILLESADSHGAENSFSFICCNPIATIKLENGVLTETYPDGSTEKNEISNASLADRFDQFVKRFEYIKPEGLYFNTGGLFGYSTYDTVRYFEDIPIKENTDENSIPDMCYSVYQYIIAINHYKDELFIINNSCNPYTEEDAEKSIHQLEYIIRTKDFPVYQFSLQNGELSNFTDNEFIQQLKKVMEHCHRGDVFQMVLSRRFHQAFTGDEFNVYRALRSINPSPYLFYFDYGGYRIFGSSPEAQLVVNKGTATIYPIAGTFRRTGNDEADSKLAENLRNDPKENAEHVMLVDLARNDLSRNCDDVKVETYREIQYYSHVIHLVSKVTGKINSNITTVQLFADTFPAGTLTGAPKVRAMELINQMEKGNRSYYGGCIGFIGFDGGFNHAIMIRSFLSKNNTLFYQAGAGVVAKSVVESELQEVNNKLAALKSALKMAEGIS